MSGASAAQEFIFSFCCDHRHPVTGFDLSRRFVAIEAESTEAARAEMFRRFGRKWGFVYESREAAGVARFGLVELKDDAALGIVGGVRQ